ncbi:hypothetical protein PF003_g26984 [Phytophthora fragariae]|nr:hypothetical protein PF003_g26989 [Phytophthora fragariae]KAE8888881.1 hypothetical protein PF003_g26984 [Phytophthora fragariae]
MANGLFLVEGTSVHMPHYTMGRMENVWGPDAEEFKPERWIDPVTGRVTPVSPFKFSAFYCGPHACLRMKFAMSEIKITLAALLSRFNLKTSRDPIDYTYRMALSLQIDGGHHCISSRMIRRVFDTIANGRRHCFGTRLC